MITPRAVLIGPPGSGKSTVAARLAQEWGVGAWDTDEDVVAASGRAIADIFIDSGEDAFRALERSAVVAALATHAGVLALGGGAVLDPATQADLRDYAAHGGAVVFLNVGLATAARRVGLAHSRPLLAGNPRRAWALLMEERRATYESLATLIVETDGLSPREIAARIAGSLGAEASSGGAS
jgi:shikimate kinase